MTRRRFILAVCVVLVAGASVTWLLLDRLSAEEQQLVGTWRYAAGRVKFKIEFKPDRHYVVVGAPPDAPPCWWYARNGAFVADYEPSVLRRSFRSLAKLLGLQVGPENVYDLKGAGDEFTLTDNHGNVIVLTRDRNG